MRVHVRLAVLFAALGSAAITQAQSEPLARVELSKRGKAATALLEIKAGAEYATAFAVHGSGLFLTTESVVRQSKAVQLILDPGLKSQRVLKAAVVRSDRDADLALLRAEGVTDLPVLPFGSADDVTELMEVVAFGFPFGTALALAKDEYPSMSVNAGSVTSLRRKAGEVFLIQLDAALNPGNAGGPVLDRTGKVVGVVTFGVKGSGVNFAIPANQVSRFLAKPDLQFTPPTLTRVNRDKALPFEARAVPVLPSKSSLELELILRGPDSKERKHRMERKGDVYRVTAVPAPSTAALRLQATVTYPDGTVSGTVADQTLTVGDQRTSLSEVRTIRFRPKPQVQLHSGKTLEGVPIGLEQLALLFDEKPVQLKLAEATEVRLELPRDGVEVAWTLVVTQNGKEIARQEGRLGESSAAPVPTSGNSVVAAVRPSKLTQDREVRPLPAPVGDVCVGGGGRFLILHLPRLRQLAVFDVITVQVVKYLPVADDNIRFAAGLDKLFVALPTANVLQRWSLMTFEREVTVPNPLAGAIFSLAMGSAARGPLVVGLAPAGAGLGPTMVLLDPLTFKQDSYQVPQGIGFGQAADRLRVSADGSVITGHGALVREGKTYKMYGVPQGAIPGPDGRTLYTHGRLYTAQGKPLGEERSGHGNPGWFVPAMQGPIYLSLNQAQEGNSTYLSLKVHLTGDGRPLVTFPRLDALEGLVNWVTGQVSSFDRHVFLIPDARLLVVLPSANDRLVLYRFDLDEMLEKAGIDYLFVASQPATLAIKGRMYVYPMTVKSRKGGVKFKLEAGPQGMTLAPDGRLAWNVPSDFADAQTDVIVTVADSTGQEVFHTFKLTVKEKGDPTDEAPPVTPESPPSPRRQEPVRPPDPTQPAAADTPPAIRPPALKADRETRSLPAAVRNLVVGGGGRFLILHLPALRQLAIFDANEGRVVKFLPLAEDDVKIAAGQNKLFVVLPVAGILQRWSLETLEREASVPVPIQGTIHTLLMGSASDGPLVFASTVASSSGGSVTFRDPISLRPWPLSGSEHVGLTPDFTRISGDGRVITTFRPHLSPMGQTIIARTGKALSFHGLHGFQPNGRLTPGPDGRYICSAHGLFTTEGKPVGKPDHTGKAYCLPAAEGGAFYLNIEVGGYPHGNERQASKLALHLTSDARPVAPLPQVDLPRGINTWDREPFGHDQRVHLIPSAKLLVVLPNSNDRLELYRVDVEALLAKCNFDYLVVTSLAPRAATKGRAYTYRLAVKARNGPATFKLEAAPDGMSISGDGRVNWQIPRDHEGKETSVIVSVRDTTGQECFHTFTIAIRE